MRVADVGLGAEPFVDALRLGQRAHAPDDTELPGDDGEQQRAAAGERRARRAGRRARRASRRAARRARPGSGSASASCSSCGPSSGAGVTAWRSARKLMKISTAPVENSVSISANAATPQAFAGATASSSQPAPHTAKPRTRHGPGPMRRLMRLPNTLAMHRADAHADVAQADCLLRQAERARREQDLHDDRRVVAHLPDADGERQRDQQPLAARRSARRPCRSRQNWRARAPERARSLASRSRGRRAGSAPRPSPAPRRPAAPAARRRP